MAAGGPRHFTNAWVTLQVLRRLLGCTLPVQLWYLGPDEMSPRWSTLLRRLDVECVDAAQVRQRYPARRLGGWECKPYAIIHSPFREVLWLDADNMPLVDPASCSRSRTTPRRARSSGRTWPACRRSTRSGRSAGCPGETSQNSRAARSCWTRRAAGRRLQLTMHLNEWSDFYYQHVYGDKETFHLAWRMLDRPYAMPARRPRKAIGYWSRAPSDDGGCWTLFQHDLAGREMFHHRTSTGKWNLFGENLRFEGFPFDAFCLDALARLRRRWDGRVEPPPRPTRPARTEAEIVAASSFCYVRRQRRRADAVPVADRHHWRRGCRRRALLAAGPGGAGRRGPGCASV